MSEFLSNSKEDVMHSNLSCCLVWQAVRLSNRLMTIQIVYLELQSLQFSCCLIKKSRVPKTPQSQFFIVVKGFQIN